MDRFEKAAYRLIHWFREEALPFWRTVAFDSAGGFFEDVSHEGQARIDRIRRVRVQPRQAYVYAHAAYLGWDDQGKKASDHGISYMLDRAAHGWSGIGDFDGVAHRLQPDGTVSDPLRDTYDHAFVLLAAAWRLRSFADDEAYTLAQETLAFLDRECGQPDGSFLEGLPASLPRRQNPHMHLFEAFLSLFFATRENSYLNRAGKIKHLFDEHFFDAHTGVIREFFTDVWQVDSEKGHLVEPGHMMEWCWLLDLYAQASGETVLPRMKQLYRFAEEIGFVETTGFLADQVSLKEDARITVTHRTWVQTEYLKATLALHRHGEPGMLEKAVTIIDRMFETYLSTPIKGGYFDKLDGDDGNVISEAMPTSTLYHWMGAAAELDLTLKSLR